MKKKLLVAIMAIIAVFCGVLGFTACGGTDTGGSGSNTEQGGQEGGNTQKPDNDKEDDKVKPVEHVHNPKPVGEKQATCTSDGNIAYYTCDCGKWFSDSDCKNEIEDKTSVIILKGHKLTPVKEEPSTCTADGHSAYYTCSGCNKWFEDSEGKKEISDKTSVVIAKGHKISPVDKKEPDCTTDGHEAYYECSGCGKWYFDEHGNTEIFDKTSVVIEKRHNYICGTCSVCEQPQPITQDLPFNKIMDVFGEVLAYEVGNLYTREDTEIVIPAEYNGKPVIKINGNAFSSCNYLKTLTLPSSITEIDGDLMLNNSRFQTVHYAGSLADWCKIDGIKNLNKLNVPIYIEGKNFCELTEISLPDDEIEIHANVFDSTAFYKDESNWQDGALYIGKRLVAAKGVTGDYKVKDGTLSIADYAFKDCTKMLSVTVPSSVTRIGFGAFSGCNKLRDITIPFVGATEKFFNWTYTYSFVYIFGSESYDGGIYVTLNGKAVREDGSTGNIRKPSTCYIPAALANVTVTGGEMPMQAFGGPCSNLKSLILPENLTSIGAAAFSGCSGLTQITIPKSVTEIESTIFRNCSALTVYCEAAFKPDGWNNYWYDGSGAVVWNCKNNNVASDGCEYVVIAGVRYALKDGKASVAMQPSGLSGTVIIPEIVEQGNKRYNVTEIQGDAFNYCSEVTALMIPDCVTTIGDGIFTYGSKAVIHCEAAEKPAGWAPNWNLVKCPVVWDCKNNDVADDGFIYVWNSGVRYKLKDGVAQLITVSGAVESITVQSAVNHNDVVYSLTEIPAEAFIRCYYIESATIEGGIAVIGDSAFKSCGGLTTVVIPSSVTEICDGAFEFCGNLKLLDYKGTKEEWKAIEKGGFWDYYMPTDYRIKCTDGVLDKDGNEITDTEAN